MQEMRVWSLGWENPLEKEMATHSSFVAWKSHGWKSLVGYSPWGCKESDSTDWLSMSITSWDQKLRLLHRLFWCSGSVHMPACSHHSPCQIHSRCFISFASKEMCFLQPLPKRKGCDFLERCPLPSPLTQVTWAEGKVSLLRAPGARH